jgi:hypothetical protein
MVSWRHEGEPHTISILETAKFFVVKMWQPCFVRASWSALRQ